MTKYDAQHLATSFHIELGRDFYTLSPAEVCCVLDAADFVKYRKPKNANGSRGRYFYAAMNRAVSRKAEFEEA